MKKFITYIVASLFAVGVFAAPNDPAARAVVRAKLDTLQATMGDHVTLTVEVLKDGHNGAMFNLPKAQKDRPMEVGNAEVRNITVDSATLQNGRTQLTYKMQLQPFEPGACVIPPFKYVIGADTFYSDITTLKVDEPPMPKEMRDSLLINPMEGTVSVPAVWYDYIPNWLVWTIAGIFAAIFVIGIIGGIFIYIMYKRTGRIPFAAPPRIPPYELAIRRLNQLKQRRIAESGNEKEYYTQLTDILREYLEGRFKIYAREMPTKQIMEAVEDNPETARLALTLQPVLQTADFVKFAKVRPLPDENIRAFNAVQAFVEATKPAEPEEQTPKK